jgi:urease accessory protein UreE
MLKARKIRKARSIWRVDHSARARKRLAEVEQVILSLDDEDLLDFADILHSRSPTMLSEIATAEMLRRGIAL